MVDFLKIKAKNNDYSQTRGINAVVVFSRDVELLRWQLNIVSTDFSKFAIISISTILKETLVSFMAKGYVTKKWMAIKPTIFLAKCFYDLSPCREGFKEYESKT